MNNNPHPYLIEAVTFAEQGEHLSVISACQKLDAQGENSALRYYLEAVARFLLYGTEDSIPLLKQAIVLHKNLQWIEMLGEIRQQTGTFKEAYEEYKWALSILHDDMHPDTDRIYSSALIQTETPPFPIQRRMRSAFMVTLLKQALERVCDGYIAECGCFKGLSTYVIASIVKEHIPEFDGKKFIVCDSFEGLAALTPEDEISDIDNNSLALREMSCAGQFSAPYETVRKNLSDFPNIQYFKGWIPDSLSNLPQDARYRFVNVDVDTYIPTAGAFHYFWPKILSGGIILSDDYNWPGARKAITEFKESLTEGSYLFGTNDYNQAWLEKV